LDGPMKLQAVSISKVKIGPRHRKEMGDLQALADSIRAEGLLQPIGITERMELVFGERRLLAVRDILKEKTIEAKTVNVSSIAAGEYAENEVRKDFTISERVAIGDAVAAEIGNRQGQRTDQKEVGNAEPVENFPQVSQGQKTRQVAAQRAGFGNETTYHQAKLAVEKGSA